MIYIPDEMSAEVFDPNVVQTISGVKRRTDRTLVEDAVKAAFACGKLKEDEPYWLREEADGGVSVMRGHRPS
jgi:hypothetical protein